MESQDNTDSERSFAAKLRDTFTSFSSLVTFFINVCASKVHVTCNVLLGKWSRVCVQAPVLLIFISLCICGGCGSGLMRYEQMSNKDLLAWVPSSTIAYKDYKWLIDSSGFFKVTYGISVLSKSGSGNILTLSSWDAIFAAHSKITSLSSQGSNFTSVCMKSPSGSCLIDGPVDFIFGSDPLTFQAYTTAPTPQQSQLTLQVILNKLGPVFDEYFAVSTQSNVTGIGQLYVSSTHHKWSYALNSSLPYATAQSWMEAACKTVRSLLVNGSDVTFTCVHTLSYGEAYFNQSMVTIRALIIGSVMTALFSLVIFSRCDIVQTRSLLALGGCLTIGMALLSGYGLGLYIGIPFGVMNLYVVEFMLLGLGADSCYEIMSALEQVGETFDEFDVGKRMSGCLYMVGMANIGTAGVNIVAVLLGSQSTTVAVKWYCWYMALSVGFLVIYLYCFFMPICVLTEKRVLAQRMELFCCFKREDDSELPHWGNKVMPDQSLDPDDDDDDQPQDRLRVDHVQQFDTRANIGEALEEQDHPKEPQAPNSPPLNKNTLQSFSKQMSASFGRAYSEVFVLAEQTLTHGHNWLAISFYRISPYVTSYVAKALVACLVIALAVVGPIAMTKLENGIGYKDIIPNPSSETEYLAESAQSFDNVYSYAPSMVFRGLDPSKEDVQLRIIAAYEHLFTRPRIVRGGSPAWIYAFTAYATTATNGSAIAASGVVKQSSFYPLFYQWLQTSGSSYGTRFVFDSSGTFSSSSITYRHQSYVGSVSQRAHVSTGIELMQEVNDLFFSNESATALGGRAVALIGVDYAIVASYADPHLLNERWTDVAWDMLAGVLVSSLILVYPVLILLLVLNVLLMQLGMFAVMWTFGFTYNVASMVQLFMATGLVVDYSLFVLYRYVTVPLKGRRGRSMAAFTESGPGLVVGGISLILFVFPMCFSDCFILRQLGILLCFAVLLGLALSLLVIPTILSYVGTTSVLDIEGLGSDNPLLEDYGEFMRTHHDHLVEQLQKSARSASGSVGGGARGKSISKMIAPNVSFKMASFREKSQGSITGSRAGSRTGSRTGSITGSRAGSRTGSITGSRAGSMTLPPMEPLRPENVDSERGFNGNLRVPSIRWAEEREGGRWGSISAQQGSKAEVPAFRTGDLENPLSADSPLNTPRD